MSKDLTVLKDIIDLVKEVRKKRSYIRITEYDSIYYVATDDFFDPMIFDKEGRYTGKNFFQYKSSELKNPRQVYFKEGE